MPLLSSLFVLGLSLPPSSLSSQVPCTCIGTIRCHVSQPKVLAIAEDKLSFRKVYFLTPQVISKMTVATSTLPSQTTVLIVVAPFHVALAGGMDVFGIQACWWQRHDCRWWRWKLRWFWSTSEQLTSIWSMNNWRHLQARHDQLKTLASKEPNGTGGGGGLIPLTGMLLGRMRAALSTWPLERQAYKHSHAQTRIDIQPC